ncbi:MAG: magnesium transporter [bacterium]|nr:magnesium transporter [bacterium]
MSETRWDEIVELLDEGDVGDLRERFAEWSESDRTHAAAHLSSGDLARLFDALDVEQAADLVEDLPDRQAADAIGEVEPDAAAEILEALASDERADVLAEVDEEELDAILEASTPETADDIRTLLEYDPESAGGLMHTEFVSIRVGATVAEAVSEIRSAADVYAKFSIQYLYAVDADGRLEGVVPLRALLLSPPSARVSQVMIEKPLALSIDDDLDHLYETFEETAFLGAPVVDFDGVLVGVVERSAVDEATLDHAEADHMKSLGISSGEELRSMPPLERSRRRLAWLSINIVLNLMAASVIAAYEETLQGAIALAVFLPIISDMSGCSGNQAVAVSLRELSLGVVRPGEIGRVLVKEITVGLVNGLALGLLLGAVALAWRGDATLGLVVGLALAINTVLAVSIGGSVPLAIKRFGWDPALASGPILTTLTDVCGFFLTLSFASAVLV